MRSHQHYHPINGHFDEVESANTTYLCAMCLPLVVHSTAGNYLLPQPIARSVRQSLWCDYGIVGESFVSRIRDVKDRNAEISSVRDEEELEINSGRAKESVRA
uniref:Uncharacterized protein n=1 Tax=Anopheles coluzzii TaxID=1518534 RepID=A0A8W7PED1_ANOCL